MVDAVGHHRDRSPRVWFISPLTEPTLERVRRIDSRILRAGCHEPRPRACGTNENTTGGKKQTTSQKMDRDSWRARRLEKSQSSDWLANRIESSRFGSPNSPNTPPPQ